jgi:hypothetical protein
MSHISAEICESERCCPRVAELFYIPRNQVMFYLVPVFNLRPGRLVASQHLNVHQLTLLYRIRFDVSPDLAAHLSP